jgi:hypothetical protein
MKGVYASDVARHRARSREMICIGMTVSAVRVSDCCVLFFEGNLLYADV